MTATPDAPLRTIAEIRREWAFRGKTIRQWAREHGFKPSHVEDVLRGRSQGKFGEAYAIAVALRLRHGVVEARSSIAAPARKRKAQLRVAP